MNIGVAGLGLIGGSIAKAFKHFTPDTVLGYDRREEVVSSAMRLCVIDLELDCDRLELCDYLIVAMYPKACVDYIKKNADRIGKNTVVMDICGVKRAVCDEIGPLAEEKGFVFIGTHPMAGIERFGFDNSVSTLFEGASMILVPPEGLDEKILRDVVKLWGSVGFSNIEITTAENHDRVIAYTSQLAHICSSAYIKSETALDHSGFSAGSYKDLTRVAYLNERMWTELFLENRDNLLSETEGLIEHLREYADALSAGDGATLQKLLRDGREKKEEADRNDLR